MTKWVYSFSAERAEGSGEMKNLLGGKGANLHEMASLGLPVPPGFTITTEVCTYFYANGKSYPPDLAAQVDAAVAEVERQTGRVFGDAANPLLLSVRSGARASMPGHDGHRPQPRPQRRLRRDAGQDVGRRAFRLSTAIAASSRCIRNVVLDVDDHEFEDILERYKDGKGYALDTDLSARTGARSSPNTRPRSPRRRGKPFPHEPKRSAVGRHRRRVLVVDEPARDHLSPPQRHSRRMGNRRQRPGDGVRQHGRDVGDRRRLHPQSLDRRERALRRVSRQRAGRGRGRGHPHAAEHHRGGAQGGRLRQAVARSADAGGVQAVRRQRQAAREALPRHAGPRVHDRARQALDAADPQRQAHRARRAARRGGDGQRGPDLARGRDHARRAGRARPAAASDPRPQGEARAARDRPARFARRGERRDRVLGRRGGGCAPGGTEDDPGARRDLARGHSRHARRRRHRDDARRHDLARRGGRARHGQALRLRRRARSASTMPRRR